MDALGIDYMFGTKGFDDKTYCLKVQPEDFAPDFIRLVFGTDDVKVVSAFSSNIVELTHFSEIVEVDGGYAIRMQCYYSRDALLNKYSSIANDTIYLVVNDVTIASANMSDLTDNGTYSYIDFATFHCFDGDNASDKNKNVLDLLEYIFNESYVGLFDGTYYFRADDSYGASSLGQLNWKYTSITETDNITYKTIKNMGFSVDKQVESRNMLVVTLDLPLNSSLPTEFTNKVKEIYNTVGFDSGAYAKIDFVIKDETKDSPADQFRIEFEKNPYQGKMVCSWQVSGPKFSKYWSEMNNIKRNDTFFTSHAYSY